MYVCTYVCIDTCMYVCVFSCRRKLYSQSHYPYYENKILTFLISEPKRDRKFGGALDFI